MVIMLKMGIFHYFALAIVAIGYSTAELSGKLQPRIIKGHTCKTTEVPSYVMVRDKGYCGGSLLTYEWVLTAGHCLFFLEGVTRIYSGFDMPPQLRQVRNVKEFHMHPKLVKENLMKFEDYRYDIGLILVDKPFRKTAATRVATLPAPGFSKQCTNVLAIGIGKTSNEENEWVKPLRQRPVQCVNLSVIDTNICRKVYERIRGKIIFDDTIICTHEPGKGVCSGDSGGPILCDNVVVGINSVGPIDCESAQIPATFTMVESHLDFIDNFVRFTGLKIKQA